MLHHAPRWLLLCSLLGCTTTTKTVVQEPHPSDDGSDGSSNDGAGDGATNADGEPGDGDGDGADGSSDPEMDAGHERDGSEGDGTSTGDGEPAGDGEPSGDGAPSGDGSPAGDWRSARLTEFESYPTNPEECDQFNGCTWAGYFAAFEEQKSEAWVMENNIAAVHSDDFDRYVFKTLRIRTGGSTIDAVVYDMCSDSDCDGCCSRNRDEGGGFLIDLEKYTMERFGVHEDLVEWTCLDCD